MTYLFMTKHRPGSIERAAPPLRSATIVARRCPSNRSFAPSLRALPAPRMAPRRSRSATTVRGVIPTWSLAPVGARKRRFPFVSGCIILRILKQLDGNWP
jgi:hypothetical protein